VLYLIPLFPFVGFLVNWALGRRLSKGASGLLATGAVIGTASTLLGIGGGSLTVPFLNYCRVDMRRAVATSSACGLVLGVVEGVGVLPPVPCPRAVAAAIKTIIAMLNPDPRNRAIGLLKVRLSDQLSKEYPNS